MLFICEGPGFKPQSDHYLCIFILVLLPFVAQPITCFSTVVIFAVGEKMGEGGIRCLGMGTDGGRRGVDHSISSSAWANPTITTWTCPSKPFLDQSKHQKGPDDLKIKMPQSIPG